MTIIEIKDFSYTYPGEASPTLRNINLSIDQGAFIVITGKSGSGKSTLGKAIAGFLFQDEEPNFSGQITVNQVNMTHLPLFESSARVAFVQQNPEDQFCTLTVMDEIAFGLENLCIEPEIIDKTIEMVLRIVNGIELKDRFIASLSGGEKQKVATASMLAFSPDVLILDEPTSNLDPIATESIFETLSKLRQEQNLTIIIIEHKLSQLKSFNPKTITLDNGEITVEGNLPSSKTSPLNLEFSFPNSDPSGNHSKHAFIDLKDVSVDRGGQRILTDINLEINPGEFIALMGPNGSGKSTLLETLMGFHDVVFGSISSFELGESKLRTSALVPKIGFIFQNPDHQIFTQSIWEEAIYTAENLRLIDDKLIVLAEELLDQTGLLLRRDVHPYRLSYGEKRRLNLICAILHGPQLLLIDELLIGQDMDNAQMWMILLDKYKQLGNSVVLVNHHANLTQKYCDRVLFMEKGQIIIDQPTTEAFQNLATIDYHAFLPFTSKEQTDA